MTRFSRVWFCTRKSSEGRRYHLPHSCFHYSSLRHVKQYRKRLGQSNFPVILLTMPGDRLVVSTAIFTDSVYANELFSMNLRVGTHVADDVLRVARVFMALGKCIEGLCWGYNDLSQSAKEVLPARVLLPNPTAVCALRNGEAGGTSPQVRFQIGLSRRTDRRGWPQRRR